MTTGELEIWRTLNECECVKKVFDCWKDGDMYIVRKARSQQVMDIIWHWSEDEDAPYPCMEPLWIPNVYDPVRPERSLIGMVKGKFLITQNDYSGTEQFEVGINLDGDYVSFFDSGRPDLALAKAIIEQEKDIIAEKDHKLEKSVM